MSADNMNVLQAIVPASDLPGGLALMIEIRQGDRVIAHVVFTRAGAVEHAKKVAELAALLPEATSH